MKQKLLTWLLLGLTSGLTAEIIYQPAHDLYLDPPEGWHFLGDISEDRWVLGNETEQVMLQFRYLAEVAPDQALPQAKTRLKATGQELAFAWNGLRSWMANWQFNSGTQAEAAWLLAFPLHGGTGLVLAFCPAAQEGTLGDAVLSALGSLAVGQAGRLQAGPMTAFYLATDPAAKPLQAKLNLPWGPTTWTTIQAADESQRLVIDRESRLLEGYLGQPRVVPAWQRYYRQIFREMTAGLGPLIDQWRAHLTSLSGRPEEAVLAWLQGLGYDRKGGVSDISTSWETLSTGRGDCDSKALLYAVILTGLGRPTILMVSPRLSHGLAAVDTTGPGARFPFADKQWLVAELTKVVPLGQIAADMADASLWIGIDLLGQP